MSLLFFVDESADKAHHFHLGVLADGAQVAAATRALDDIVDRAYDAGLCRYGAEIHGEEIVSMKLGWNRGRTNVPGLVAVADEILTVLSTHDIEIISRGVALPRFRSRYGQTSSPHPWLFVNVMERLNERLTARGEYGLVIADAHHQYGPKMRRDLHEGQTVGTSGYRGQVLDRIVDTVHFVDSKHSRLVQLADMAAYVRRRREGGRERDPRFEAAMDGLGQTVQAAVAAPTGAMDTVWHP